MKLRITFCLPKLSQNFKFKQTKTKFPKSRKKSWIGFWTHTGTAVSRQKLRWLGIWSTFKVKTRKYTPFTTTRSCIFWTQSNGQICWFQINFLRLIPCCKQLKTINHWRSLNLKPGMRWTCTNSSSSKMLLSRMWTLKAQLLTATSTKPK